MITCSGLLLLCKSGAASQGYAPAAIGLYMFMEVLAYTCLVIVIAKSLLGLLGEASVAYGYNLVYQLVAIVVVSIIITECLIFTCFFAGGIVNSIATTIHVEASILGDSISLAYTNSTVLATIAILAGLLTIQCILV